MKKWLIGIGVIEVYLNYSLTVKNINSFWVYKRDLCFFIERV
ncbi:hypothetical protein BAMA111019_16065 [Bacillus manliponensis]